MVKYREIIIFEDVFALNAANLMDSGFAKAWCNLQFLDLLCQMYLSWQAQDAANLMVSDFAKASRNLQLLDCIFRGRRRTRLCES